MGCDIQPTLNQSDKLRGGHSAYETVQGMTRYASHYEPENGGKWQTCFHDLGSELSTGEKEIASRFLAFVGDEIGAVCNHLVPCLMLIGSRIP